MSCISETSITNVLIPENVLKHVKDEKVMSALTELIIGVVEQSLSALSNGEFLKFDANTAAFDCERLALCMYSVASSKSAKEESKEILKKITDVKKKILDRKDQESNGRSKPEEFFSSEIASIKISKKIAYLLQAHTLTCTKTIAYDGSFKTDTDKLYHFTSTIADVDSKKLKLRFNIVKYLQQELSKRSLNEMKKKTSKIMTTESIEKEEMLIDKVDESESKKKLVTIKSKEKESLMKMFDEGNIVKKTEGLYSRYFSCCYTNEKSVMWTLQQKQMPIILKRWVRQNDDLPLSIMLRSPSAHEAIECLSDEEIKNMKIDEKQPIIVFQATIPAKIDGEIVNANYLRKKIADIGFYQMILADVSTVTPFGSKSDVSMVKVEDIKDEMTDYQKKVKILNGVFVLDHVYCSNMSIEKKE